ncbi:MAG: helix-turn-helix domain-containing protein [Pseudomonadota bacterium]
MRIGLLLYNGCMPAGLLAFNDLLQASNRLSGKKLFETCLVGTSLKPVQCANQMVLTANSLLEETQLDVLLVPGMWTESPTEIPVRLTQHAGLIDTLQHLPASTQVWSYCTGVCLLAASGRLKNQKATVTWWLVEFMQKYYSKVHWQIDSDCMFTNKVATAAGVHGYLLLAQQLIEKSLSKAAFQEFMKLMVLPRPVQHHPAFRSFALMEQADPLLRKLAALVTRLPAEEITVGQLASRLNMSERTLARKVQNLTQHSVASYVRLLKLQQVSEQLIWSAAPVSSISESLGYSNESNLRRQFKTVTGLSPFQYRQKYAR